MTLFLGPTRIKLVFLAEWLAFSIWYLLQTRHIELRQFVNLLWPMMGYYLFGCCFVFLGSRSQNFIFRTRHLSLIALTLVGIDHTLKLWVSSHFTLGEYFKIVPNHLHILYATNFSGSWILSVLGSGPAPRPAMLPAELLMLLLIPFIFRYYVHRHYRRFWPSIAFVGLWAGLLSYSIDMNTRGAVIDYLNIPGVVTADFKDILLSFGVAAFVIEAIENPAISMKWIGWRAEYGEVLESLKSFSGYVMSVIFNRGDKS